MSRKYFRRLLCSNMKKTGLNRYVYDFSLDYAIAVDDKLDIHKYIMEKNGTV